MEQPNPAPYSSSPYTNMMELPVSQQPLRCTSNGPTPPDSRQHSFDESAYFTTVPHEALNFPVSQIAETSVDPWYMSMPGTATPESSRLSMSPSQGIATPSSEAFYSPHYPEQLPLPTFQYLEQPQPLRSCSTSHPNWISHNDNWDRIYAEGDLWSAHPFVAHPFVTQQCVAQTWISSSYNGYAAPDLTANHPLSNNAALSFEFRATSQHQTAGAEITPAESAPLAKGPTEDNGDSSSDDDSDDSSSESDYSQSVSTNGRSKPRVKVPRPRVDRWAISVPVTPQFNTRAWACREEGCTGAFQRPEHLRRHHKSKHSGSRPFGCLVPDCTRPFSRRDNLRDHYWTHLDRGGRKGQNSKYTMEQLRVFLCKEKKLMKKLKDKLRLHQEKERLKSKQTVRPASFGRCKL